MTPPIVARQRDNADGFAYYEVSDGATRRRLGEVWKLYRQQDGLRWAGDPTGQYDAESGPRCNHHIEQRWFRTRAEAVNYVATWEPVA